MITAREMYAAVHEPSVVVDTRDEFATIPVIVLMDDEPGEVEEWLKGRCRRPVYCAGSPLINRCDWCKTRDAILAAIEKGGDE